MPGVSTSPDNTTNLDVAGADLYTAAGAIAIKKGLVILQAAGALAMTLALPTAGTDDGKVLSFLDISGHAHTITTPANGLNNAHTICTMSGTAGNKVTLHAWNGQWWMNTGSNGALSA